MTPAERLRQMAALARAVVSELDLETVLSRVTAALRSLRSDAVCAIRLVDEEGDGYRLAGTAGFPAAERASIVPFGEGLTHVVAQTRLPLLVEDNQADPRAFSGHWSKRSGLTTYYGVPIEAAGEVLGVVNMNFPPDSPPTEEEQASIEALAAQAAVAIRNARLFAERDERRQVAESLAEVSRALAETLDADVIAQQVADSVRTLLHARVSFLFRVPPGADDLVTIAVSGDDAPDFDRGYVVPGGTGLAGVAIRTKRVVVTPDFPVDPRVALPSEWRRRLESATDRAVLAVPLLVQDRVIGALSIRDRAGRAFSDRDRALARAFADQAALALHNAQLLKESRDRQGQLEALLDVTRELSALHPMEKLLELIAATCGRLLDSDSVGFRLLEDDELVISGTWGDAAKIMAAPRLKLGESASGIVAVSGEPLVITDIANDPRVIPAHRETLSRGGYRHWLGVPVKIGPRLLGVLSIRTRRDRGFTQPDVAIATAFAAQAAVALESARLYAEAKRAYEELARAQSQMVRVETLRAVGELAAGASHHLNNLLAVVVGRLDLALRKFDDAELHRHLLPAERAAQDGANVVKRLLRFSRGQTAAEFVAVDLNELASEVIELTRPRWQNELLARGILVDVRLDRGLLPSIPGDPSSLREVLMNLILNAVDALPSGGRITVTTWAEADAVSCRVADTGIGMSRAVQARAFEPFFTTKGVKSTGLGLSANYGILQRHGGEFTIESEEGRGTQATFRLPILHGAEESVLPLPHVSAPALRILVIDDENEVRAVIADMLTADGHEVISAATSAEGLQRGVSDVSIDLVLTDIGMPGMTGWELAAMLKASRPPLIVGAITGWGEAPEARPEERALVDFVLPKPITEEALRAALAHALGSRGVA